MEKKKPIHEGYQPEKKGYQPKPKPTDNSDQTDTGAGYQPTQDQGNTGQARPPKKP